MAAISETEMRGKNMQLPITSHTLETERLLLRAWNTGDLEDFFAYASEPGVGERAGWKHHQSLEESQRILDAFIAEQEVFAVVLKTENRAIGSLGVHPSWASELPDFAAPTGGPPRVKEIGYVITRAYWGRGLIPEAVRAVIEYAFEVLGLEALTVGHFPENKQSKRVIEKCGFTYFGTGVFHAVQLGREIPELRYMLRRSDWLKRRQANYIVTE